MHCLIQDILNCSPENSLHLKAVFELFVFALSISQIMIKPITKTIVGLLEDSLHLKEVFELLAFALSIEFESLGPYLHYTLLFT